MESEPTGIYSCFMKLLIAVRRKPIVSPALLLVIISYSCDRGKKQQFLSLNVEVHGCVSTDRAEAVSLHHHGPSSGPYSALWVHGRYKVWVGGKRPKLTAVPTQHSLHILLQFRLAGIHGRVGCLEYQRIGGGVHKKDVPVVLLHCGAGGFGAEVPDGHELLPLEAAAVDGPHIQHSDVYPVGLAGGAVLRGGAHLALDDHGRSVRLVLEGVETRGVTGEGDPDDQHGEMHWIKPHAVSLCCAAVLLGGGASWRRETADNGLRQSRQGRAADVVEVSMPSVSASAFPIRLLASDGGDTAA